MPREDRGWKGEWTLPAWRSGLDGVVIELVLPAGARFDPRCAAASPRRTRAGGRRRKHDPPLGTSPPAPNHGMAPALRAAGGGGRRSSRRAHPGRRGAERGRGATWRQRGRTERRGRRGLRLGGSGGSGDRGTDGHAVGSLPAPPRGSSPGPRSRWRSPASSSGARRVRGAHGLGPCCLCPGARRDGSCSPPCPRWTRRSFYRARLGGDCSPWPSPADGSARPNRPPRGPDGGVASARPSPSPAPVRVRSWPPRSVGWGSSRAPGCSAIPGTPPGPWWRSPPPLLHGGARRLPPAMATRRAPPPRAGPRDAGSRGGTRRVGLGRSRGRGRGSVRSASAGPPPGPDPASTASTSWRPTRGAPAASSARLDCSW